MIKCFNNGDKTCISRMGTSKRSYATSEEAIAVAKYENEHQPNKYTKKVAYKCSHCHKYHLTAKTIKRK